MTEGMHFRAPRISKYVLVMMLDLAFYTKYPDGMGEAVKNSCSWTCPQQQVQKQHYS